MKNRANIVTAANWKSTGPDKLPNFWIKQFTSLNESMAKQSHKYSQQPQQV